MISEDGGSMIWVGWPCVHQIAESFDQCRGVVAQNLLGVECFLFFLFFILV